MTPSEALAWVATMFEEPLDNVRPETPRDEIFGWDSLGVLALMAELDEKFDIRVGEQEMTAMTSVQDILNVLQKHGKLEA